MQQLTFTGPQRLEWLEVAPPELDGGADALVRPIAVATCDLDMPIVRGTTPLAGPFALGHEFVAEVVSAGENVVGFAAGDRVIVPFQISCGECVQCRRGHTATCASVPSLSSYGLAPFSREWGGALSDLVRVPFAQAMLVPLPDGVDPVAVASLSDNIPDGLRAVVEPLEREPGASVLVLGGADAGGVGLYAAACAVALGSERVDYVDADPVRLRAAQLVGANAIEGSTTERRGRYPITVNHSDDPAGLTTALRSTVPEGTCFSTAVYFEDATPVPLLAMYTNGVTLRTGRVNSRAMIPRALELITSGRLHPEHVTAQVVEWADAAEALATHKYKTVVRRELG
jgi:threonine dehydrogenase-like Zn-dependent dehydrogenase